MKIIELRAHNIKRLTAINIKPDGNIVEIRGANGAGKSSVLDAMHMALAGKGASPEQPIRQGQSKASVFIDLGDGLKVRREWSAGAGTKLTVTGKKGGSPQAVLDALVGKLTFDPLEFMRMKPAERQATLLDLLGIQDTILELAEREAIQYGERAEAKKRADEAVKGADAIAVPDDTPIKPVDIGALTTQLSEAHRAKADNDDRRRALQEKAIDYDRLTSRVAELKAKQEEIAQQIAKTESLRAEELKAHDTQAKLVKLLVDSDIDAIQQQMQRAQGINENVAMLKHKEELLETQSNWTTMATASDKAIKVTREERRQLLEGVEFPVTGLSIDGGTITFNDIPFDQCSASEQLRVSLHIGMAENPTLKVLRVKDGSLLDEETLKQLYAEVTEADYQLWIERVGDNGDVGIVIEDGHVRGAE